MAVAARQQVDESNVRRARRGRKQQAYRRSVARCVSVVVVLAGLIGYVGLYAKITQNGFHRAKVMSDLRQAKMENQYLRAQLQMLASPDRLSAAAVQAGMVQSKDVEYLRAPSSVRVAQAETGE